MSDLVVIDASVLLAIALPDPQANKDYAVALLFAIDKGDVAPVMTQLCHHEVAAKLVRKVRGQSIKAAKALEFFDLMAEISFQHVVDIRDFETLFADVMDLGCGSYDGAYLRAALDNGAQLATLDKKLIPHLNTNGVQHWKS
jgi:predicted nucleic acid-binding protein